MWRERAMGLLVFLAMSAGFVVRNVALGWAPVEWDSSKDALLAARPIDLNEADVKTLAEVPAIGPVRAAAIVTERDARGAFASLKDLERVGGVGPATVAKIRDFVSVPVAGPLPSPLAIDVNTATVQELVALPGIGPVIAGRIVEERRQKPFRSLGDLERVKGIGKKTVDRLVGWAVAGGHG